MSIRICTLFVMVSNNSLGGALHIVSGKRSAPGGLVVGESHPRRTEWRSQVLSSPAWAFLWSLLYEDSSVSASV